MFKFTIRDLLWLTVVAALAVAWWVDRRSYVLPDPWAIDMDSIVYLPVAPPSSPKPAPNPPKN